MSRKSEDDLNSMQARARESKVDRGLNGWKERGVSKFDSENVY
jgi:hypothetical protein